MEELSINPENILLPNGKSIPKKPKLPSKFTEFNPWLLSRHILMMGMLWIIPALVSYSAITNLSLWLSIPIFIFCGWLSSFGLAFGQWLGHDGCHGAVLPDSEKGMMLGTFFASATPMYSNIGFAAYHLEHHKYVNTDKDEDVWYYSQYNSLLSRLFIVRILKNRAYLKGVIKIYEKNLGFGSFSPEQTRRLILSNAAFSVFWLMVYAVVAYFNVAFLLALLAAPVIGLAIGTGCLTYQQHANTGDTPAQDYWRNSRSLTNSFWTMLYAGGNFHLEHHLYPRVPVWNLPKVHQYLKERGYLDHEGLHLDNSTLAGYKYFGSKFSYPAPSKEVMVRDAYINQPIDTINP